LKRRLLSIPAFAGDVLCLFLLPMMMVSRDVSDRPLRAGLLPGPTQFTAAGVLDPILPRV